MVQQVKIYTDGACRGNPGPGGWGVVLYYEDEVKTMYGSETLTTNNRMELFAAISALRLLDQSYAVQLYTDSQYLKHGITQWIHNWKINGWKSSNKKLIKNKELWEELDRLAKAHHIQWHWVKAHAGDVANEKADALANQAIDEMLKNLL